MLSVFVYGTLKPGGRYYERYCGIYQPKTTPALIRGKLFNFPHLGYPAITIGDSWVKGYLYQFSEQPPTKDGSPAFLCSHVLSQLDSLEGYCPDKLPKDNEYERFMADVFDLSGQFLQQAWSYRMSAAAVLATGGLPIANGNWSVS